jgi:hypothetical protein
MKWILVSLALLVVGCMSQSYRVGVTSAYPKVADRLDQLSGQVTPVASELRASTSKPIRFARTSLAWKNASGPYRLLVGSSPNLTDHRRADWLSTADLLDNLNATEARHESLMFLFPTTSPSH